MEKASDTELRSLSVNEISGVLSSALPGERDELSEENRRDLGDFSLAGFLL